MTITSNKHNIRGFTIVELLVVIVIIGILAASVIVSYVGLNQKVMTASIKADLSSSSKILKLYYTDNGHYPADLDPNNCPTEPADVRYCLKPSSENIFSYESLSPHSTYSLTATNGDLGYVITNSTPPIALAPKITITEISAISGTPKFNQVLTAGSLTPSGATVSYQWKIATTAGGTYSDIAGATSSTYTPVLSDIDKYVKITVNGTGGYTGSVTSAATAAIQPASVSITVNGSAFTNNNPYDSLTWWGADYTVDDGDLAWETTSTFNLGPYVNGTISGAVLSWDYSSYGGSNGGRNRYIIAASPRSTLYSASTTTTPTSYSGTNLNTYVNSKQGTNCQINWEADNGSEGADIWGIEVGMSNPRLTFTWTP